MRGFEVGSKAVKRRESKNHVKRGIQHDDTDQWGECVPKASSMDVGRRPPGAGEGEEDGHCLTGSLGADKSSVDGWGW